MVSLVKIQMRTKGQKLLRTFSTGYNLPCHVTHGSVLIDIETYKWRLRNSIGIGSFRKVYLGQTFLRMFSTGYRLSDPLFQGSILTDIAAHKWKLGKCIAATSSAEVYLASNDLEREPTLDARYAIKVEHTDGTLHLEIDFYECTGSPTQINWWMKENKLAFFGMPRYINFGFHEHNGSEYKFMVMERYGENLERVLEHNNGVLPVKTVYAIGKLMMDILEYVHYNRFIYRDINASNLVTGYGPGCENEIYLIDFASVRRFHINDLHEQTEPSVAKANEGTTQFISIDGHIGAYARRSDLENLGYNMLQWLCGHLPWEDELEDIVYVHHQKRKYLSNISSLMNKCFPERKPPSGIVKYFSYVAGLKFEEKPKYRLCKNMFSNYNKEPCKINNIVKNEIVK